MGQEGWRRRSALARCVAPKRMAGRQHSKPSGRQNNPVLVNLSIRCKGELGQRQGQQEAQAQGSTSTSSSKQGSLRLCVMKEDLEEREEVGDVSPFAADGHRSVGPPSPSGERRLRNERRLLMTFLSLSADVLSPPPSEHGHDRTPIPAAKRREMGDAKKAVLERLLEAMTWRGGGDGGGAWREVLGAAGSAAILAMRAVADFRTAGYSLSMAAARCLLSWTEGAPPLLAGRGQMRSVLELFMALLCSELGKPCGARLSPLFHENPFGERV